MATQFHEEAPGFAGGAADPRIRPDRNGGVFGHFEQASVQQVLGHMGLAAVAQKGRRIDQMDVNPRIGQVERGLNSRHAAADD